MRSASALECPARRRLRSTFASRTPGCFAVEARATEEIDLLQLGEHSRTGIAARRARHLVDGETLVGLQAIGEEVLAVEMAGDDENVAAHLLAARRSEPIRAAVLDQLDELVLARREVPAHRLLFVGRVDGDRAHRQRIGGRRGGNRGREAGGGQQDLHGRRHDSDAPLRCGRRIAASAPGLQRCNYCPQRPVRPPARCARVPS